MRTDKLTMNLKVVFSLCLVLIFISETRCQGCLRCNRGQDEGCCRVFQLCCNTTTTEVPRLEIRENTATNFITTVRVEEFEELEVDNVTDTSEMDMETSIADDTIEGRLFLTCS